MKRILFLILLLNIYKVQAQNYFKVEEIPDSLMSILYTHSNDTIKNNLKYFKIKYFSDSSDLGSLTYPILLPDNNLDTLEMIKELLQFRGDIRLCALPIRCYNPLRSQLYLGNLKNYSLQLEALFIINQLYIGDSFKFSSYPILLNSKNGKCESIGGEIIEQAYNNYEKWYLEIKKVGFKEAKKRNLNPLMGSSIQWY